MSVRRCCFSRSRRCYCSHDSYYDTMSFSCQDVRDLFVGECRENAGREMVRGKGGVGLASSELAVLTASGRRRRTWPSASRKSRPPWWRSCPSPVAVKRSAKREIRFVRVLEGDQVGAEAGAGGVLGDQDRPVWIADRRQRQPGRDITRAQLGTEKVGHGPRRFAVGGAVRRGVRRAAEQVWGPDVKVAWPRPAAVVARGRCGDGCPRQRSRSVMARHQRVVVVLGVHRQRQPDLPQVRDTLRLIRLGPRL